MSAECAEPLNPEAPPPAGGTLLQRWFPSRALRLSFWLHIAAAIVLIGVGLHAAITGGLSPSSATILAMAAALVILDHVALTLAGLCPRCSLLGPNIIRLPEEARRRDLDRDHDRRRTGSGGHAAGARHAPRRRRHRELLPDRAQGGAASRPGGTHDGGGPQRRESFLGAFAQLRVFRTRALSRRDRTRAAKPGAACGRAAAVLPRAGRHAQPAARAGAAFASACR